MTFLEALSGIDKRVSKLNLRHPDGELMEPIVALAKVGCYHGDRFDHVIEALKSGTTTPDDYFLEMIKMIMEYQARQR